MVSTQEMDATEAVERGEVPQGRGKGKGKGKANTAPTASTERFTK